MTLRPLEVLLEYEPFVHALRFMLYKPKARVYRWFKPARPGSAFATFWKTHEDWPHSPCFSTVTMAAKYLAWVQGKR